MKQALIFIGIMLTLSSPLLPEDEIKYYDLSIPLKEKYNVGFSSFTGKELAMEHAYLVNSVPLLLMEELDILQTHTFSEAQKQEYRKYLIRQEISIYNKNLENTKTQIDKIVFEKTTKTKKEKKRKTLEKQYEKTLQKISELKALDPGKVKVPDELDIEMKFGAGGLLFNPPAFSPLQFLKNNNIDLLFFGKLEEIHGYIYFEVSGFDRILEKEVFYYKDIILPEDVYTLIPEIKRKLIKIILGRDWSSVKVVPEPADALIYINNKFAGIGTTIADYLKPGLTSIKVSHPDYFEQTGMMELAPYEEKHFDIFLEKIDLGIVRISSLPSGAVVYMNSKYIGPTPLDMEKSNHLKRIVIKKEGFDDYIFHIGHKSTDTIVAELQKSLTDPDEKQENERDNFYTSFGLFLVSIPIPIFLKSFAKEFSNISENDIYNETLRNQYKLMGNIFNVAYWVTFGVNGGLAVNMVFNLRKYITAADRPIG